MNKLIRIRKLIFVYATSFLSHSDRSSWLLLSVVGSRIFQML